MVRQKSTNVRRLEGSVSYASSSNRPARGPIPSQHHNQPSTSSASNVQEDRDVVVDLVDEDSDIEILSDHEQQQETPPDSHTARCCTLLSKQESQKLLKQSKKSKLHPMTLGMDLIAQIQAKNSVIYQKPIIVYSHPGRFPSGKNRSVLGHIADSPLLFPFFGQADPGHEKEGKAALLSEFKELLRDGSLTDGKLCLLPLVQRRTHRAAQRSLIISGLKKDGCLIGFTAEMAETFWERLDGIASESRTNFFLNSVYFDNTQKNEVHLRIHLLDNALTTDPVIGSLVSRDYAILRKYALTNNDGSAEAYDDPEAAGYNEDNDNVTKFFNTLKSFCQSEGTRSQNDIGAWIQHPDLIPTLRHYQKEAIAWMYNRERSHLPSSSSNENDELQDWIDSFRPFEIGQSDYPDDGAPQMNLWANYETGMILSKKPQLSDFLSTESQMLNDKSSSPSSFSSFNRGGILGEEMGLGKTVEILALILLNPKTDEDKGESADRRLKNEKNTEEIEESLPSATDDDEVQLNISEKRSIAGATNQPQENQEEMVEVEETDSDLRQHSAENGQEGGGETVKEVDLTNENENDDEVEATASSSSSDPKRPRRVTAQKRKYYADYGSDDDDYADDDDDDADCIEDDDVIKMVIKRSRREAAGRRQREDVDFIVECLCGNQSVLYDDDEEDDEILQCIDCGKGQHAKCVNWNQGGKRKKAVEIPSKYCCPQCTRNSDPIEGKATLIISPSSICYQWSEEITKHVRKASMSIYVCLDEAQMVEGVSTAAASMCRLLISDHRWCITGTPIQKSIHDLFGLLMFLNTNVYSSKLWWNMSIWQPFMTANTDVHGRLGSNAQKPMMKLMSRVMWRTEKSDVVKQLGIPDQTQLVHWLDFSPVEEHYYKRTITKCRQDAARVKQYIQKYHSEELNRPLALLNRESLTKIMAPLINLRQACSYPRTSRSGKLAPMKQKTMNMSDVLSKMIQETRTEAEADQRKILAAHNGRAGIHWLESKWLEAAEAYRNVLRAAEEHSGRIQTDQLPLIHALFNLNLLLKAHQAEANIPPTLRDGNLEEECRKRRAAYLRMPEELVQQRHADMLETGEKIEDKMKMLKKGGATSWIIDCCRRMDEDFIVDRVKTKLIDVKGKFKGFTTVKGLIFSISSGWDRLTDARREALSGVGELHKCEPDSVHLNDEPTECHLRPVKKPLGTCKICTVHNGISAYEDQLFSFEADGFTGRTTATSSLEEPLEGIEDFADDIKKGTWNDSPLIVILKTLYSICSRHTSFPLSKNYDEERTLAAGKEQLELIEMFKIEFRNVRKTWMAIGDYAAARDELTMSMERLRFATDEEREKAEDKRKPIELPINIVRSRAELPVRQLDNDVELDTSRLSLERKLGQLAYLTNLEKMGHETVDVAGDCPICMGPLTDSWVVLSCGHCLCMDCLHRMEKRADRLKCAVCRVSTGMDNVSYVSKQEKRHEDEQEAGEDKIEIEGAYSTKIEAIIRCLLRLKRSEPDFKALIFTEWSDLFWVIKLCNGFPSRFRALNDNGITFQWLRHNKNKIHAVTEFRSDDQVQVLLLPFSSGANGLNIVEANHVFLVEPLLNLSAEAQAISRVHRIGQRRRTTIHRFLVRNTIEQHIYNSLQCRNSNNDTSPEAEGAAAENEGNETLNPASSNDCSGESAGQTTENSLTGPAVGPTASTSNQNDQMTTKEPETNDPNTIDKDEEDESDNSSSEAAVMTLAKVLHMFDAMI